MLTHEGRGITGQNPAAASLIMTDSLGINRLAFLSGEFSPNPTPRNLFFPSPSPPGHPPQGPDAWV
jgi:hypothetical protein